MKKFQKKFFYHFYKMLFGLGLLTYYKKITVSGLDKIPINKPIITTSNHPTGLMDVFLASHYIKREIKFTAAGALFKDKLQAAFLTSVGTIPVYRRKDSPGEQDKNVESFEHCFKELELGGAIGFYPEGTSHPEPWVNSIKTGAARVALQAEQRNDFKLNLLIIPIGINSPHPGKFRETVFVNIGDPIAVNKYQQVYQQDPIEAVNQLTAEIQQGMEACAFHIQDDAMMNIFETLKIVGINEIEINGPKIACKAEKIYNIIKIFQRKNEDKNDKESESSKRFNVISQELNNLKQHVQIQGIRGTPFQGTKTVLDLTASFFTLILVLPILIPSIVINILPFMLSKNLGKKLAGKDLTLIPAGRLMLGTVIFLLFYLLIFSILSILIGCLKAIAICTVLLTCGYLTLWCWEILKGVVNAFRKLILWAIKGDKMKELIEIRCSLFKRLNEYLISM